MPIFRGKLAEKFNGYNSEELAIQIARITAECETQHLDNEAIISMSKEELDEWMQGEDVVLSALYKKKNMFLAFRALNHQPENKEPEIEKIAPKPNDSDAAIARMILMLIAVAIFIGAIGAILVSME